jgi:hypothetical protein
VFYKSPIRHKKEMRIRKDWRCKICEERFSRVGNLQNHVIRNHHKNPQTTYLYMAYMQQKT